MIIQEEKRETKMVENYVIVKQRIYGCDNCKKEINLNRKGEDYIEATVHSHNSEYKTLQYCSWKCFAKNIKKQKSNYFISLPYLSFDNRAKGLRAKDFFDILK